MTGLGVVLVVVVGVVVEVLEVVLVVGSSVEGIIVVVDLLVDVFKVSFDISARSGSIFIEDIMSVAFSLELLTRILIFFNEIELALSESVLSEPMKFFSIVPPGTPFSMILYTKITAAGIRLTANADAVLIGILKTVICYVNLQIIALQMLFKFHSALLRRVFVHVAPLL